MAIDQVLGEILDETVEALSHLDSAKLHALEQRIVAFAESNANYGEANVGLVLSKKRLLEIMLQNCHANLDALTRLHVRNTRNQWAQ